MGNSTLFYVTLHLSMNSHDAETGHLDSSDAGRADSSDAGHLDSSDAGSTNSLDADRTDTPAEVDLSVLEGADHRHRSVEEALLKVWPAAVPTAHARQWLELAEQMVADTPPQAPAGCDPEEWVDVRRSAVRDVQAAAGWMARAEHQAGEQRLTQRLTEMGWKGEVADQPAWSAMEQSARAALQCRELAELAKQARKG